MLADYFERNAVAAAQVLEGFDTDRFRAHLENTPVGLAVPALRGEAAPLSDMSVRLLARLYPQLALRGPASARAKLAQLAQAINPKIEIVDKAEIGIVVGGAGPFDESIFAGSTGWQALVSATAPRPVGQSQNPLGAGAAAALAAGSLFRRVFLSDWSERRDHEVRLDTFSGEASAGAGAVGRLSRGPDLPERLGGDVVLVGAGAIGNGTLWALSRVPVKGLVHIVDHETVELSNLQRYVLTSRDDVDQIKVNIASDSSTRLRLQAHVSQLAEFLSSEGSHWEAMLLALDSAEDRVSGQASLPKWIANAWTQPGDLGVSSHSPFGGRGACVSCLYLPTGPLPNEDQLVAEALGIPQMLMQVRTLLYTGAGVDRPLLAAIAQAIGTPLEVLEPFESRSIRELYVEGFCGGAVIPLGAAGRPRADARDVHVPLAHQSVLAGVLLAASMLRHTLSGPPDVTTVTRLNVLRAVGEHLTQPTLAAGTGRCICEDTDFRAVYADKYR